MNSSRRYAEIVVCEPAAFIGPWNAATSSFVSRLPERARTQTPIESPKPNFLTDVAIALSSLAMIFSIPGLILYLATR
jgi:hypothetical protein